MNSEPIKIQLRQPIQAHGEDLREITIRPPKGKDLRGGMPYRILSSGEMDINSEAVAKLISSLAEIPPSSVDQLSALDFQDSLAGVMSFFREPTAESTS